MTANTTTPETQEWTSKEVAALIGVPFSTLKRWLDAVPIPCRVDGAGHRKYNAQQVEIIRRLYALVKLEGRHLESVRVLLEPELATAAPADEPGPVPVALAPAAPSVDAVELIERLGALVRDLGAAADRQVADGQKIGALEERARGLELEASRARAELAQARVDEAAARAEASRLAGALEEARRPWWRFGR